MELDQDLGQLVQGVDKRCAALSFMHLALAMHTVVEIQIAKDVIWKVENGVEGHYHSKQSFHFALFHLCDGVIAEDCVEDCPTGGAGKDEWQSTPKTHKEQAIGPVVGQLDISSTPYALVQCSVGVVVDLLQGGKF